MMGIVYRIKNIVNGKCYIGITTQKLQIRMNVHSCMAHSQGSDTAIHRAIRKYGASNFEIEAIDCSNSIMELQIKETYWIKGLNTISPNGYNLTQGGDGVFNPSEETRRKMSAAAKVKLNSPNGRAFILGGIKHRFKKGLIPWNKGVPSSPETIERLRATHLGIKQSEQSRRKKSESLARTARKRTHCRNGHELTPENTRIIKGKGVFCEKISRRCRICYSAKTRVYERARRIKLRNSLTYVVKDK